jgi:CxxC motif-containing protein (DUF1111 family)
MSFKKYIHFLLGLLLIGACNKTLPPAPSENELLDGPLEGLTFEQQARFLRGDEAFGEVFTASKGLGPIFVANSCASCHAGDGKGTPFVQFTRFGQADTTGNKFLHLGGPQLQHKAIPGFTPEKLPIGAATTNLIAPAVTGLGFLDAVPDQNLIDLSDPNDLNNDGISGRPHWNTIPDYVQLRPNTIAQGNRYITRFGKKGGAYNLLHQTAGAYNQDMGITSIYETMDVYTMEEIDPEIATTVLNDVVFYLKTLKAPLRRNEGNVDVKAGENIFVQLNCNGCHTPSLQTGESNIPQLANKEFYPYTNMLLHDMGPGLDDGYTEGYALTSEWKTPALWGLGLSKENQGGSYFLLHDGRATSIEQAIELHGGEAQQSRDGYIQLSQYEKKQLITFLESL